MPESNDRLTPADLAFALGFRGRKRVHNADQFMAEIVAKRLVEYLERAGFLVMKRPPAVGGSAIAQGFEGGRLLVTLLQEFSILIDIRVFSCKLNRFSPRLL